MKIPTSQKGEEPRNALAGFFQTVNFTNTTKINYKQLD